MEMSGPEIGMDDDTVSENIEMEHIETEQFNARELGLLENEDIILGKPYCLSYNDYSALIYKHPGIYVNNDNNFISVRTNREIEAGELLIVEHSYIAEKINCYATIYSNQDLFDKYYPRERSFRQLIDDSDNIERAMLAREKVDSNCFGMAEKNMVNIFIHKINHCCNALCSVNINETFTQGKHTIVFMELYSLKRIPAETEITISYGKSGHHREFVCNCGYDDEERGKRLLIGFGMTKIFRMRMGDRVDDIIRAYLALPVADYIIMNQMLSNLGIYLNRGTIKTYTPDGIRLINKFVHKYTKIPEDEIIHDDDKFIDASDKYVKNEIFLKIIRNAIDLKNGTNIL